jgi:hypothetical protein
MFCWLPGASRPETRILRIASSANRRFEFDKRGEPFIRSHNETLSVAAMRVSRSHEAVIRVYTGSLGHPKANVATK